MLELNYLANKYTRQQSNKLYEFPVVVLNFIYVKLYPDLNNYVIYPYSKFSWMLIVNEAKAIDLHSFKHGLSGLV